MSQPQPKHHIVFDIVGSCVSFDSFFNTINTVIGPKLTKYNISPAHFGYTWMTAAELEFTFLSISSRYKPYKNILSAVFYRTLYMAGVQDPRGLIRDEVKECFRILREGGFQVWCLTTGDLERVKGYFRSGGVEMPEGNLPDLGAYRAMLRRLKGKGQTWFAAAHMWDVSAAVKVGFHGAYCTVYEREGCEEIFGEEMGVVADGLVEMAKKIVKASHT
ncbi:hypothetical protein BDV12DRAFT_208016 [Aspergillus spectabilis]